MFTLSQSGPCSLWWGTRPSQAGEGLSSLFFELRRGLTGWRRSGRRPGRYDQIARVIAMGTPTIRAVKTVVITVWIVAAVIGIRRHAVARIMRGVLRASPVRDVLDFQDRIFVIGVIDGFESSPFHPPDHRDGRSLWKNRRIEEFFLDREKPALRLTPVRDRR